MVTLINKNIIRQANIDTVERAIIFACTILRATIVNIDNSNNRSTDIRIRQTINQSGSFINLEANLKYNSYLSNYYGGHLINFINEFDTEIRIITELPYTINKTDNPIAILPDYRSDVINTFEKYLTYYSFILRASLPLDDKTIEIKQLEENNDGALLKLTMNLPFNYQSWLTGNNYISSVNTLNINEYVSPFKNLEFIDFSIIDDTPNLLNNETLLKNNQLLNNGLEGFNIFSNQQTLTNEQLLTN